MFKNLFNRLSDWLRPIVLTLWVGGLWVIGYLAVPILFSMQPDRPLAGRIAGQMFTVMGWVGLGCALYLLACALMADGMRVLKKSTWWIIVIMLIIGLTIQFGVQPLMSALKAEAFPRDVMQSLLRPRFVMLHGASSVLYLIECLLGAALVVRMARMVR